MSGKLYGVGVGPGDPELLTLKAIRIIQECDYIAIPCDKKERCLAYTIAEDAVPSILDKPVILVNIPMTNNEKDFRVNYGAACDKLIPYLDKGSSIAFLTIGDPTIYSVFLYIHNTLKEKKYDCEIINGITTFCAAAAALNEGLVSKGESLHLLQASYDYNTLMDLAGTKVIMKAGKQLTHIKNSLYKKNMSAKMVANCCLENQEIHHSLDTFPKESNFYTLVIAKDLPTL